jgi:hypothetical protein
MLPHAEIFLNLETRVSFILRKICQAEILMFQNLNPQLLFEAKWRENMNIEHNDKWQSLARVYNINYLLTESEVFTVKY